MTPGNALSVKQLAMVMMMNLLWVVNGYPEIFVI
jgi:hypothetical protein